MTSDPLTLILSLTNMKKKKNVYIQTSLEKNVFNLLCVGGKVNSSVLFIK